MRIEYHIASSVVVSGLLYAFFCSWKLAVANLIAGVFIDIDHVIDFVVECGKDFDVRNFFKVFNNHLTEKVFVFLHSWELLAILSIIAWLTTWNVWVMGLLIGYAVHMTMDQSVTPSIRGYFLIWRINHNFDRKGAFPVNRSYKKESKNR